MPDVYKAQQGQGARTFSQPEIGLSRSRSVRYPGVKSGGGGGGGEGFNMAFLLIVTPTRAVISEAGKN